MTENEILAQRIKDINDISFADSISEITASLSIVLTLYEIDDEPKVIGACKTKLMEGVKRLTEISIEAKSAANEYKPK